MRVLYYLVSRSGCGSSIAGTSSDGVAAPLPESCAPTPADADGDGVPDALDRCPASADAEQPDFDADGRGDSCDVCWMSWDPVPTDTDGDGIGDACDPEVRQAHGGGQHLNRLPRER
jgi:hypothetical protein